MRKINRLNKMVGKERGKMARQKKKKRNRM